MPSSVITRKGQVTIPKAIRDEIRLQIGDRVSFVIRNGEIVLKPPPRSIFELQGSVKPDQRPEDFDRVRREVQRQRARKVAESE